MARLEDGEAAYENVLQLFRQSTRHNLFDVCGLKENSPFQIDGNLGGPSGVVEMLLQSHAGVVRLLPALPKAWPEGSFRGLRARGGVEIDMEWKDGKATKATLRATQDAKLRLALPAGHRVASMSRGNRPVTVVHAADETYVVSLERGATYELRFI
jgi:alpha-L-fucosidase 2